MKSFINVMVPMKDGVRLSTNIFLPEGQGSFPTLIFRTPYGGIQADGNKTGKGYALVSQDCRGKFNSEGIFSPIFQEESDGQDTIAWVAEQPWCNGRIGLYSGSYHGMVQVPAAIGGHPAVRCMAPCMVGTVNPFREWIRYDGCFAAVLAIRWAMLTAVSRAQAPVNHIDWMKLYQSRSLDELFETAGAQSDPLREWIAHDQYDEYWSKIDQTKMHPKIKIPALHSGGWFDQFIKSTVWGYQGIRDHGATQTARDGQKILIGPWGHGCAGGLKAEDGKYRHGEVEFPYEATLPHTDADMQLFDHYLKDLDNGYDTLPRARIYILGENRWAGFDDWPPKASKELVWYLDSDQKRNPKLRAGLLRQDQPARESETLFKYNPLDPAPTWGGALWDDESEKRGMVDQRPLLNRSDVLFYGSNRLESGFTIMGPSTLELYVSSSASDTDIVAKLCMETPDGRILSLTVGCLRLRYRKSWSKPEALTPGAPERVTIDMGNIACKMPEASRICILITSSDFPHILPNSNTMAPPFGERTPVIAENRIIQGPNNLSCLRVTVLPRS